MTDEELYEYAQRIWCAVEKGGWDGPVAAARRLAERAAAGASGFDRDERSELI